MWNFIKKRRWYKRFTRKLYEDAHPWREQTKWALSYNGYSVTVYDMSYWGEQDQIRIAENDSYEGRIYKYTMQDGRQLTVNYLMNEYSHLPVPLRNRLQEIFNYLDIPNDKMDELHEKVTEFFGVEEL